MSAGLRDGGQCRHSRHLEGIRRHVHGHRRAGHGAGLGRGVPADDGNAAFDERLQPWQQRARVAADDDEAVGVAGQRVDQHPLPALQRAPGIEDLHVPADGPRGLDHAVVHAQDAAVAQVLVDDGNALAGLGPGAGARSAPARGRLRRGNDDTPRFRQVGCRVDGRGRCGCRGRWGHRQTLCVGDQRQERAGRCKKQALHAVLQVALSGSNTCPRVASGSRARDACACGSDTSSTALAWCTVDRRAPTNERGSISTSNSIGAARRTVALPAPAHPLGIRILA